VGGILNRRYAMLGWAVWMLVRQQAKRRARKALRTEGSSWRGRVTALSLGVATAVGLVFVWRKLRGGDEEWQAPEAVEAPTVDDVPPTPLGTAAGDDDVPPAA
jgi:hypothetical protein